MIDTITIIVSFSISRHGAKIKVFQTKVKITIKGITPTLIANIITKTTIGSHQQSKQPVVQFSGIGLHLQDVHSPPPPPPLPPLSSGIIGGQSDKQSAFCLSMALMALASNQLPPMLPLQLLAHK